MPVMLTVLLIVAIVGGAVFGAELVRGTCRRMLSNPRPRRRTTPRPSARLAGGSAMIAAD
ncbi:MAG: hypothetical protein QOE97_2630 [Pseudonocardiales bacterium]|jgi:UPF0716 family protein affecting phage T7 exclusion|nr:hypothetical protein [Pseudonocardiales bacterium]